MMATPNTTAMMPCEVIRKNRSANFGRQPRIAECKPTEPPASGLKD
jgi:hypothetical protein